MNNTFAFLVALSLGLGACVSQARVAHPGGDSTTYCSAAGCYQVAPDQDAREDGASSGGVVVLYSVPLGK